MKHQGINLFCATSAEQASGDVGNKTHPDVPELCLGDGQLGLQPGHGRSVALILRGECSVQFICCR